MAAIKVSFQRSLKSRALDTKPCSHNMHLKKSCNPHFEYLLSCRDFVFVFYKQCSVTCRASPKLTELGYFRHLPNCRKWGIEGHLWPNINTEFCIWSLSFGHLSNYLKYDILGTSHSTWGVIAGTSHDVGRAILGTPRSIWCVILGNGRFASTVVLEMCTGA